MRKRIVVALLGLVWIGTQTLGAQRIPAAVVEDPPVDKKFPPSILGITIASHGVDMDATLYLASGRGSHGTVLLLNGLPGYEQNIDLAQSVRRAGWNVLLFHYRGTWGTAGTFSGSAAIEDTAEAIHFLRDPANTAKYRMDPHRLVVIGHSFGGFLAGYQTSHDPGVAGVAIISATNLGKINAEPGEKEIRMKRWETQLHPVRGTTASELFAEAARHSKDWDYLQWAEALRACPVLLIEADDQNHDDMEALATALRQKGSVALDQKSVATDHTFSDHRIALQAIVIDWLEKLEANSSTERH